MYSSKKKKEKKKNIVISATSLLCSPTTNIVELKREKNRKITKNEWFRGTVDSLSLRQYLFLLKEFIKGLQVNLSPVYN